MTRMPAPAAGAPAVPMRDEALRADAYFRIFPHFAQDARRAVGIEPLSYRNSQARRDRRREMVSLRFVALILLLMTATACVTALTIISVQAEAQVR